MKAARFYKAGQPLVVEKVPLPRPGPEEVLLKVVRHDPLSTLDPLLRVLELGEDQTDDSQPQYGGDLLIALPIPGFLPLEETAPLRRLRSGPRSLWSLEHQSQHVQR